MRRLILCSILLALISCLNEQHVDPATPATFVRYINGGNEDTAEALEKTSDGGYIILANTRFVGVGSENLAVGEKIKLVKTNAYGSVEWTQILPTAANEDANTGSYRGHSIYVADDGYIISGEIIDDNGNSKLMILTTEMDGAEKTHFALDLSESVGVGVNVYGMAAHKSAADAYLVLGSVPGAAVNMVLAEVDPTATPPAINWQWGYGAGASSVLNKMFIDTSKDVIFGGTVNQDDGNTDMRLIKAEQVRYGAKFSEDFGESGLSERMNGMCRTVNGYALIGSRNNGTEDRILFTKVSDVGGELLSMELPVIDPKTEAIVDEGNQVGNAVALTSDNGYIILSTIESTSSIGRGITDYYLIKTNGFGDVEWRQAFGSKREDVGVSVVQADDGGYVILGTTQLANVPTIALIKTNAGGEIE